MARNRLFYLLCSICLVGFTSSIIHASQFDSKVWETFPDDSCDQLFPNGLKKITVLAKFFNAQLDRVHDSQIACSPDGLHSNCPSDCFIHRCSDAKAEEIAATLQLAFAHIDIPEAGNFIAWYELGRIRKNPYLVEKIKNKDDWKSILFSFQYFNNPQRSNKWTHEIQEKLIEAFQRYKMPMRQHYEYIYCMIEFNKVPATARNDFSLLFQPSMGFTMKADEQKNIGIIWLYKNENLVVHHAKNGASYIYDASAKTAIREYKVQNTKKLPYVAYSESIFPIIRYGQDGIQVIQKNHATKTLFQKEIGDLVLSSDNRKIIGTHLTKDSNYSFILLDITDDMFKQEFSITPKFESYCVVNCIADSTNSSTFFIELQYPNKKEASKQDFCEPYESLDFY